MAGRKIGEIYGEIKLKNQQFNTGLAQSQSKLKVFGNTAKIAFTAITVAGIAAGAALIKMTKDTVRYANEVRKASLATGVAVEQFQELAYAAKQEHADVGALEKGLGNLTIRLGYAGDELETYLRYFRALGIEYKNQDGTLRNTIDVFYDIADKAHKGALSTEELAAITQLFGARAGRVLIPMLRKGSDWFKKMAQEGHTLGIVMLEEDVEAVKKFDDSMTRLKESFNAAKRMMVMALLPSLQEFARWALEVMPIAIGGILASLKEFELAILRMQKTWIIIKSLIPDQDIDALGESLFNVNQRINETVEAQDALIDKWAELSAKFRDINLDIGDTVEEAEELNEEMFVFSETPLGPYLHELDLVEKGTRDVREATGNLEDGIYNVTSAAHFMGDAIYDAFKIMNEEFEDAGDKVDAMVDVWKDLVRGILSTVGGPVGVIASAVSGFFGFQKGGFVPGALIPQVSSGYVQKPSVLVGEGKGGELVIPEDKLKDMVQVTIHNANPHTYVDTLINLPQSEKQRLYRRVTKEAADREGRR